MDNTSQEIPWLKETYALLREYNRAVPLKQIANEAGVCFGWLNDFSRRRSVNPGIIHVFKLNTFLKQKTAAVASHASYGAPGTSTIQTICLLDEESS